MKTIIKRDKAISYTSKQGTEYIIYNDCGSLLVTRRVSENVSGGGYRLVQRIVKATFVYTIIFHLLYPYLFSITLLIILSAIYIISLPYSDIKSAIISSVCMSILQLFSKL